ncbi:MAG TPA: dATP pyrophosphohydrolase [Burkholderiales bacterium]|nr:dATP pyrophosphohydrolase [Burkholderiales bacterium]
MSAVEVLAVRTPAELDRFIRLPARLYGNDPSFIPPLLLERKESLSPRKNPYFQHAEAQFFLATRGGRDVGRISAQVDRLARDAEGHFGLIAAEDDAQVFAALFEAAEGWLRARGCTRVVGPFNLSINEESGLLVDGFDTPPMLLMAHDPRYAGPRIEACGYAKAKDTLAYLYDVEQGLPRSALRLIDERRPARLTVRNLDARQYLEEFDRITAIFNDAWSGNWGFIPFTEAEIRHMAKSMKPLVHPELVAIAELDRKPIGFGVLLPNLNEAIADFDGRLMPFNWLKLLLRLKRTRTGRVPLMGIRRSHNGGVMGGLIAFLIIDRLREGARRRGMQKVELSWILEDNWPMRRVIESLGAAPYKTYRLYEKVIA